MGEVSREVSRETGTPHPRCSGKPALNDACNNTAGLLMASSLEQGCPVQFKKCLRVSCEGPALYQVPMVRGFKRVLNMRAKSQEL